MASLYRPRVTTWKLNGRCRTPDGKRVTKATPGAVRVDEGLSKTWYGKFTLPSGEVRRVKLTTDKTASKQILAKLVVDAKLAEHDLDGGRFAEHAKRALAEHAEDFRRALAAKGRPPEYVAKVLFRLSAALDGCRFVRVGDLQESALQEFLGGLLGSGKSTKTVNDYLAAVKRFTRWLRKDGRTASDTMADVAPYSRIKGDERHARRDFSPEELQRLLACTRRSQRVFLDEQSGADRHALYLTACSTGFRAGELASMTPESFDLTNARPVARVKATCTKNKKEAVQPIPSEVAAVLRAYLAGKAAGENVWPGQWYRQAAVMIRADLGEARGAWLSEAQDARQRAEHEGSDFLAYVDAEGRYGDFHALRHSFITMAGKLGLSAKEHQDLARHSTYKLTERYAHSKLYDLSAAVERLPIPTGEGSRTLAATGTDGRRHGPRLDQTGDTQRDLLRRPETEATDRSQRKSPANQRETLHFPNQRDADLVHSSSGSQGIETPTGQNRSQGSGVKDQFADS
jgi:integrase